VGIVEGDGGVEALFTSFGVVNRADLETVLSTTHLPIEIGMKTLEPQKTGGVFNYQTRLPTAIASALSGHDTSLAKNARAAVIAFGEGDAVLVVLAQVKVAAEPSLHAGIRSHNLDEFACGCTTFEQQGIVKNTMRGGVSIVPEWLSQQQPFTT